MTEAIAKVTKRPFHCTQEKGHSGIGCMECSLSEHRWDCCGGEHGAPCRRESSGTKSGRDGIEKAARENGTVMGFRNRVLDKEGEGVTLNPVADLEKLKRELVVENGWKYEDIDAWVKSSPSMVDSHAPHHGEFRDTENDALRLVKYCKTENSDAGDFICVHRERVIQEPHWSCCGVTKRDGGCTNPNQSPGGGTPVVQPPAARNANDLLANRNKLVYRQ